MIWLYRLLFPAAMLLASPYYFGRMRKRGGYRENFGERFGATPELPAKRPGVRRVWLQAVSVGEMLAIAPLLEALAAEPAVEVYLTTTTSTGYALARERYAKLTIAIGYFPIDWWPFSRRTWRRVQPDLAIILEGERWPEHLRQAEVRGVPVLAVNARLSDRSFRRMMKLRALARPLIMGGITRVLACSTHDEERFRELGFAAERVSTTGNLKLDVKIPLLDDAEKTALRKELGFDEAVPVLLGSSTWPGEEAVLLDIYKMLRAEGRSLRLLIVPRHAERRDEIETLLRDSGLTYHLRSRGPAPAGVDVAVGDTTGELRKFTQLAEVVFIGKSLPPHHEGQTPVEAAALGKPVVFGPKLTNFRTIARDMLAEGAARSVADAEELRKTLPALWENPEKRDAMSAAARRWREANQGAVARTLEVVRRELAALDK